MNDFLKNLPKHISLSLHHNEHKNYYETVKKYLETYKHIDFVSEEQKQKCIDNDDIWVLYWYPDTPIGFCSIAAYDLEELFLDIKRHFN